MSSAPHDSFNGCTVGNYSPEADKYLHSALNRIAKKLNRTPRQVAGRMYKFACKEARNV